MEGQFSYQDFDLLIEPGPPGSYRARVLRSPAGKRLADNPELAELPWEFPTTCGGPVPAQSRRVGHTGQLSGYERYCAITSDGGRHWPVRRQLSGMG
jgi:hypothetical protein